MLTTIANTKTDSKNNNLHNPIFKTIANIITGNLLAYSTKLNKDVNDLIPQKSIIELAKHFEANKINNQGLNKAIEILIDNPDQANDLVTLLAQHNLIQVTDTKALGLIADEVIIKNPAQAEQYQSGKIQIIGFLVGQCMKQSGGTGNPKVFGELLAQKLA